MHKTHEPRTAPHSAQGTHDLLEVRGNLPHLAWVVGARLTACQFTATSFIIQRDPALEAVLAGLGAEMTPLTAAFVPDATTTASDATHRLGRRHVQFHVARMHGDDGGDEDGAEEDGGDAEPGPPAANA